jgi:hypothetical protein
VVVVAKEGDALVAVERADAGRADAVVVEVRAGAVLAEGGGDNHYVR